MARRNRTPVGAWYWGYAGLGSDNKAKPVSPSRDRAFDSISLDPPLHTSRSLPNNSYDRDALLLADTQRTRSPMAQGYDGYVYRPPQSYAERRRSWDVAKGDAPPYDSYKRPKSPRDMMLYNPSYNHPGDVKHYDTSDRNAPDDLRLLESHPRNGPGDFRPYESSPRAAPWDGKQYDIARNNGLADRERELQGRYSPRKMTYEPSFHDPGATPRSIPQWEREQREREQREREQREPERGYQRSLYGYAEGRDRPEPPRGEGALETKKHQKMAGIQNQSVFLFLRFRSDDRARIGQACQAAVFKDLRGEFVGITDGKAYQMGRLDKVDRGYAVFLLPSLESAQVFFNRDRIMRQPDFPQPFGDLEIFAVNMRINLPSSEEYKTFVLSEITLSDGEAGLRQYEDTFAKPFARLLMDHGAIPYVAFSDHRNRRSLKRHSFDKRDIVTLHLFHDPEQFLKVMSHPEYKRLDNSLNGYAITKWSVFTVRPEYCP